MSQDGLQSAQDKALRQRKNRATYEELPLEVEEIEVDQVLKEEKPKKQKKANENESVDTVENDEDDDSTDDESGNEPAIYPMKIDITNFLL
jgi:hypothetical protein